MVQRVRDPGEDGKIPVVVEEKVQFNRPLGLVAGGPVKKGQTEFHECGVEAEELVLETELPLPRCYLLDFTEELVEDGFVKLPCLLFIGIGKRGTGRSSCRDALISRDSLQSPLISPTRNGPGLNDRKA